MQFDYENLLLCLACLQLLIVFAGLSAIASYKPVFKVFEKIGSFYFIFVNRKSERFSMRILLKKKI